MTQLSQSQLAMSRQRPQSTRLNLFLFTPRIIFQARVNDASIGRDARTITYNNVTNGSYLNIEAGMSLLVGTTAGGDELGRIRVRSATSSQLVVSENSNIAWANGAYLTVLRYFELWPVYPRIIHDPADAEQVIFYKDYDIAYGGQNSTLGTFICMGPHRPVLLVSGTASAWYTSSGTYNLLGHGLTYEWSFEGGNPSGSTSANPGYVSYNTPGNYVTRLIVTDSSNGVQDISYRYVAVRNKIGSGSNTPIVRWKMEELTGSKNEGGYSVQLTIYDTTEIDDNAVVMLYSDDWYGGTNQSLGGNYPNSPNIFFVGLIDKDSIRYNYEYSYVNFSVISLTKLMKDSLGFSIDVRSVSSPSTWYELLDLDVRRSIYHYLRWHTTALSIADFQFIGQDYPIQFFDSDRTSMFDAIDNLMRSTLVGHVSADRQGKIWAEVDAKAYSNPTGSFPSTLDITKQDWKDFPDIDEIYADVYSYIEMGGIQYSGVGTGTFTPLMACAPGTAPSFRGKIEKTQGLALGSQSQLNSLVGNLFANRNSRYPRMNMSMANNLSNFDIAPQESSRIIITPDDTIRRISLDALYQPESVTWTYDAEKGFILPRVTFENILTGIPGQTIIIPQTPDDGGLNNGFNIPGFSLPAIPPFLFPSLASSIPVWKGTSSISVAGATLTSTTTFENFATTINVGGANIGTASGTYIYPTALIPGVYLVTAYMVMNTKADFTSAIGSIVHVLVGGGGSETESERFKFPNLTTTDFVHIPAVFLCNAGDQIRATFGWTRSGGVDTLVNMSMSLTLLSGI